MNTSTKQQILRMIKDSGKRGAENFKLSQITLGYRSRITELRQDGYDIRARRIYRDGKATGTYVYYLNHKPSLYDQPLPTTAPIPPKQASLIDVPRRRNI